YTQIHMEDFEYDTSIFKIVRDDYFDKGLEFTDVTSTSRVVETTIKYTLSGFTRKEAGNWVVNYPIIFHIPEPVLNTRFSITSENEEAVLSDWRIVNDKGNIIESSQAQSSGNFSHITGLSENVILSVTVPSDMID